MDAPNGAGATPTAGSVAPALDGAGAVVKGTSPIYVGVPYADSAQSNAVLSGIGKGLQGGDVHAVYTLLADDLNARGGIRGHKVVPVFYRIDLTSNIPQEERAACQDFTVDHHVLVAFGDASPAYSGCVLKGGGAVVQSAFSDDIAAEYRGLDYVYQPAGLAQDTIMGLYGPALKAMGYFTSTTPIKLGVLYEDLPAYHVAEAVLERSLNAMGIKIEMKQAFAPVQSESDIGRNQSQVQGAVLKFRAAGITNVLGVENNAWLIGFFGVGAASQGYYPRYAYDSNEVLNNVAANVPARALQGSVFFGYYPPYDTFDTTLFTPAGRACLALLHDKGYDTPATGNGYSDSLTACDNMRFLEAALRSGTGAVSRDSLALGVKALGSSYQSAITFRTLFRTGLGYVDGVDGYRTGKWDQGCSCFSYTSSVRLLDR